MVNVGFQIHGWTISHVKRDMQDKTALVKWIERAMAEKGWTPPELARRAKIDKTAAWRIITKGTGRADIDNIDKMMDALGLIPTEGDLCTLQTSNNVLTIPRKHPELYELLDAIDKCDDPWIIEAAHTRLWGVNLMLKDDVRAIHQRLDLLEEMLRKLLNQDAPPKKKAK